MEPFFQKLKTITLSVKERTDMRSKLYAFIKENPVRVMEDARLGYRESNIFNSLFTWRNRPMQAKLIASILLATVAGGAVSYAAEGSLPGDTLYPIKVHVNENIRGAVALSTESRAQWETRRVERRLEEAEELAAEGKLNTETRASIEGNFKTHTENVHKGILELKSDNNTKVEAEVSSHLEASLKAHERILSELGHEKETVKIEVEPILIKVRSEVKTATRAREDAEDSFSTKASVDVETAARGKQDAAEHKIAEVKTFIASKKESWGAAATADAETRIKLADTIIIEGKAKLDAKAYGEAFAAFQKAHRIAEEAKLLVTARSNFKIQFNAIGAPALQIEDDERENASSTSDEDSNDSSIDIDIESQTKTNGTSVEGKGKIDINVGL